MRSGGACQFVSTNCREKREARGAAELMNVVEGGEKNGNMGAYNEDYNMITEYNA